MSRNLTEEEELAELERQLCGSPEPVQPSLPLAGLFDDSFSPIPLETTTITARILDFASYVTVKQKFRNKESKPLEVRFIILFLYSSNLNKLHASYWQRKCSKQFFCYI